MILVAIMLFACQVPQEEPTNVGSGRTSASDNGDGGNESGDKGVEAHFKSPDSSRVLQPGGVLAIEWFDFPNFVKDVTINLWGTGKDPKEEKFIFTITTIQQFNFNSGVYKYDLPLNFFEDVGKEYEVDKFKVEIIDKKNEYSEKCDIFEINPIKFENPTRNENDVPTEWFSGESANIEWIAAGIPANADYAKMKIIGRKVGSWDWEDVYIMTEYDLDPTSRQARDSNSYTWSIPQTFYNTYCKELGFREDSFKIVREIYDVNNNLIVSGTSRGFIKIVAPIKDWLIMYYMCIDNDLDIVINMVNEVIDTWEFIIGQNHSMTDGFYHMGQYANRIKIIALVDRGEDSIWWHDTRAFEITKNGKTQIEIPELGLVKDGNGNWITVEKNMASTNTLRDFISFCKNNYNDYNHYSLILWNHGDGSAVCFDDTDGGYLEASNIISALTQNGYNQNNKLEVLGLDACYMGNMEYAYNFKDIVNSMYFSPDIGCFIYYYWDDFLDELGNIYRSGSSSISPNEYVLSMVKRYKGRSEEGGCEIKMPYETSDRGWVSAWCEPYHEQTVTAADLTNIVTLNQKIDSLVISLMGDIFDPISQKPNEKFEYLKTKIYKEGTTSPNQYISPDYPALSSRIDIGAFCRKILSSNIGFSADVISNANNVLSYFGNCILASFSKDSTYNSFDGYYLPSEGTGDPFGLSLNYRNNWENGLYNDGSAYHNDPSRKWKYLLKLLAKYVLADHNNTLYRSTETYITWKNQDLRGKSFDLKQNDDHKYYIPVASDDIYFKQKFNVLNGLQDNDNYFIVMDVPSIEGSSGLYYKSEPLRVRPVPVLETSVQSENPNIINDGYDGFVPVKSIDLSNIAVSNNNKKGNLSYNITPSGNYRFAIQEYNGSNWEYVTIDGRYVFGGITNVILDETNTNHRIIIGIVDRSTPPNTTVTDPPTFKIDLSHFLFEQEEDWAIYTFPMKIVIRDENNHAIDYIGVSIN